MLDSDGSVTSESTVATESLASQRARCLMCGGRVPSQRVRRGAPKVYCTDRCRYGAYDREHPRQRALEFERVKPAPPTGEPYQKARVWLLERLETGPVSTFELRCPPWNASQNPAQRVLELRNKQYDIRTVRGGGKTWYWLWKAGEPVGKVEE